MSKRRSSVGDAPLLAWGDALRAAAIRRKLMGRRLLMAGSGLVLLLGSATVPPSPRFVWNASNSAPIGLYWVTPELPIDAGDMVIAKLPAAFRDLAARRQYLPKNVPLVKRAVAVAGDDICGIGQGLYLNGRWIAARRDRDAKGRMMPIWQGCVRLHGGQLFLLMPNPASFDGRYFGVTDRTDIVGKARPIWAR